MTNRKHIAILGTGISGAVLSHALAGSGGIRLSLFDKARGVGGRMSTRYGGGFEYDHGAQFFTARGSAFQNFLADLGTEGVVQRWQPKIVTLSPGKKPFKRLWFEDHYVSAPRMNSMCKHLLKGLDVFNGTKIVTLESEGNRQFLVDESDNRHGPFDLVVSTAPAEQTMEIFNTQDTALGSIRFTPCFAVMIPWQTNLPGWHAATVQDSSLEWLCFNHRKPGRTHQPSLIAHSTGAWAAEHFNMDLDAAKNHLLQELTELIDVGDTDPGIHRWRYARVTESLGSPYWLDEKRRLAACGDWCLGNRIEDTFNSAMALADKIKQML